MSTGPSVFSVRGSTLTAEETAALTVALQAVVAARQESGAATAEMAADEDRTLSRRRALGLWERPGTDSWRFAAGRH